MTKKDIPNIIEYITDPELLNLSLSEPQETLLRAIYGLPLSESQLDVFHLCTGRSDYKRHGFSEVTALCGARAGKDSRIACPIASYEATLGGHDRHLAKGERAIIPVVAQDARGTRIAFGYLKSHFMDSPLLKSMLEGEPTANEIRLTNNVSILCFPSSYTSLRGWSIPVALLDEVGFWRLEGSADSDVEIQASIRRGMINFDTTRLIKISTPYMKSGVLYDDYKNHYAQDTEDILVWKAPSRYMNPVLKESRLERERRLDPLRFAREYEAEFAEDLESFLPSAWIEQAIIRDRHELPPVAGNQYSAGCDATGLSDSPTADCFTLSITHRDGDMLIQDLLRGWKKSRQTNVDLEGIVSEIAAILERYGLYDVHGDRYSGQWVVEAFRKAGVTYVQTEFDKSHFYLEMEPLFAQGKIEILDHPDLDRELRLLERRPRPGGKVFVDHPRGRHDDHANSLAISIAHAGESIQASRGFSQALHVAKQKIEPMSGAVYIGQTLIDAPATVVAQEDRGAVYVLAAFCSEGMSLQRHLSTVVRPWLQTNLYSFQSRMIGVYEEMPDKLAQANFHQLIEQCIGGNDWQPSESPRPSRREALLDLLGKSQPWIFGPALQISPDARLMIEALSGRWSFENERRDKRNVWYYVANAFSLLIERVVQPAPKHSGRIHVDTGPESFTRSYDVVDDDDWKP
jgi:hypothetical protein